MESYLVDSKQDLQKWGKSPRPIQCVLELVLFCTITVEAAFTANCIGQWTFTSLLCCYSFRRIRSEAEQRRKFDNLSVATYAAKSKQKRERIRRNERALGRLGVPVTPRICHYANWSAWHLFPPLLAPLMCVTESSMSRATRNSRLGDGGREDFYREVRLRKERPPSETGNNARVNPFSPCKRRPTLAKNEDF